MAIKCDDAFVGCWDRRSSRRNRRCNRPIPPGVPRPAGRRHHGRHAAMPKRDGRLALRTCTGQCSMEHDDGVMSVFPAMLLSTHG